ncbi:hypothetical protein [Vibrio neptunius]|uniref:hypothetical protein n=1 Tax=Vibrio neptunius TaxID=170651 RepID=UPI001C5C9236|nr:hypothetical protein [Vibrio neptunius]QXX08844.1 hypothetical protein KW548_17085 [Vibrio neptunius]
MKYKLAPFVVLVLSGCVASPVSQSLSPGVYEINVTGSILASKERYKSKLEDKALKECPNGYEALTPMKYEYAPSKSYVNGVLMNVPGDRYTMKIQCK